MQNATWRTDEVSNGELESDRSVAIDFQVTLAEHEPSAGMLHCICFQLSAASRHEKNSIQISPDKLRVLLHGMLAFS